MKKRRKDSRKWDGGGRNSRRKKGIGMRAFQGGHRKAKMEDEDLQVEDRDLLLCPCSGKSSVQFFSTVYYH